jgi:hypothetical protein
MLSAVANTNNLTTVITTPAEIAELETFFRSLDLPKTLKLNTATTINNLPKFVNQVLENLKKTDISEASLRPRYDDLIKIKNILKKDTTP